MAFFSFASVKLRGRCGSVTVPASEGLLFVLLFDFEAPALIFSSNEVLLDALLPLLDARLALDFAEVTFLELLRVVAMTNPEKHLTAGADSASQYNL
jgi:hypothetical protein